MASFSEMRGSGNSSGTGGVSDEVARLKESTPFQPVAPNSLAKGDEALAEAFGKVSTAAFTDAAEIKKEQSNDQLLTANSALGKITTQAKVQMLQDSTPGNISNVMKGWQQSIDGIKINSKLSASDKRKLLSQIDTQQNELTVHGATLSIKNVKETKKRESFENLSGNLDQLKNLMQNGKYEEAEKLGTSMYDSAKTNLETGVWTGPEFIAQQKALHIMMDKVKNLHDAVNNPDLSAKDYHDLHNWPFNTNGGDATALADKPSDQTTSHLVTTHLNDQSYRGQSANAIKNGTIDPSGILDLQPHQQLAVIKMAEGAQDAQNYLKANNSWPQFLSEYHRLKSQPDATLDSYDKGKLEHMNYIIQNFKTGNSLELISDTVKGAQNEQSFQIQSSVINDSGLYNSSNPENAARQEAANSKVLNDYVSGNIAIMTGMHIPNEWYKPFHTQFVEPIHEALQVGGDPQNAIKAIQVTLPENKSYLVNQMPNAKEQETMRFLSLANQNTPIGFQKDMVLANQKGADFSPLKVTPGYESKLRNLVESELGEQLGFMYRNGNATTQLGEQVSSKGGDAIVQSGQQRMSASLDAMVNYVKKKALDNGDFTLSNVNDYINELKTNVKNEYPILKGWNYEILNSNLGMNLTPEQASATANAAFEQALGRLKEGHNEVEYQHALDRRPLFMTIDQFNNIVVTDPKTNAVLYHIPFSSSFVESAMADTHKKLVAPEQKKAEEIDQANVDQLLGLH